MLYFNKVCYVKPRRTQLVEAGAGIQHTDPLLTRALECTALTGAVGKNPADLVLISRPSIYLDTVDYQVIKEMAEGPLTVRMSKSDSVETLTNPANEDVGDGIWGAADRGDIKIVQKLLDDGVDVNARNCLGCVPLMYAAGSGPEM